MAVAAGTIARGASAATGASNAAKAAKIAAAAAKTKKPLSADDAYLSDYVVKNTPVEQIQTKKVETVDEELADAVANSPGQTTAQKKAVETGRTKDEKAEQKERERQEKVAQQALNERTNAIQRGARQAGKLADPAIKRAGRFVDRVGSARTVGGIGLLVAILVLLMFVVVKVNASGDTRAKQFWYMLNGRARLEGRKNVNAGDAVGSGDFETEKESASTPAANAPLVEMDYFSSSYRGFTNL